MASSTITRKYPILLIVSANEAIIMRRQIAKSDSPPEIATCASFEQVIDEICGLNWAILTEKNLIGIAWVYYYFSVQFRESLEIARGL